MTGRATRIRPGRVLGRTDPALEVGVSTNGSPPVLDRDDVVMSVPTESGDKAATGRCTRCERIIAKAYIADRSHRDLPPVAFIEHIGRDSHLERHMLTGDPFEAYCEACGWSVLRWTGRRFRNV